MSGCLIGCGLFIVLLYGAAAIVGAAMLSSRMSNQEGGE